MAEKLKLKRLLTPEERTKAAANEMHIIMQKYNCKVEIVHELRIFPNEDRIA